MGAGLEQRGLEQRGLEKVLGRDFAACRLGIWPMGGGDQRAEGRGQRGDGES